MWEQGVPTSFMNIIFGCELKFILTSGRVIEFRAKSGPLEDKAKFWPLKSAWQVRRRERERPHAHGLRQTPLPPCHKDRSTQPPPLGHASRPSPHRNKTLTLSGAGCVGDPFHGLGPWLVGRVPAYQCVRGLPAFACETSSEQNPGRTKGVPHRRTAILAVDRSRQGAAL